MMKVLKFLLLLCICLGFFSTSQGQEQNGQKSKLDEERKIIEKKQLDSILPIDMTSKDFSKNVGDGNKWL